MPDKYALIPVGDEQEAGVFDEPEPCEQDPADMHKRILELRHVVSDQDEAISMLSAILDGYSKDMRCPKCGGPIELAFTTACWRCQQTMEIENLRTQLSAYETPLSKVVKARLRQLWRRLR